MRPYVLKGHKRPLTQVKFNREGDLVVTCAKGNDDQVCIWYTDDGMRLGTFDGHRGAVYGAYITRESDRLFTASADASVKLWDLRTGQQLYNLERGQPCRAIDLSVGEQRAAFTTDSFKSAQYGDVQPLINIYSIEDDSMTMLHEIQCPRGRITRVYWTDMNRSLLTSHDDGCLRKWDSETGKLLLEKDVHNKEPVQDLQVSENGAECVTASLDKTAKLIDIQTLEVLKTYSTERFVNTAAISPLFDHVVLGGGQDASQVTTTAAKAGGFEARFFHKIYAEEFATVRGHFGPINTAAFSPSGRSFVTGGEDGLGRLHHFDMDYFTFKFY